MNRGRQPRIDTGPKTRTKVAQRDRLTPKASPPILVSIGAAHKVISDHLRIIDAVLDAHPEHYASKAGPRIGRIKPALNCMDNTAIDYRKAYSCDLVIQFQRPQAQTSFGQRRAPASPYKILKPRNRKRPRLTL